MRRHLVAALAAALVTTVALPGLAGAVSPSVDPNDDKITGGITYVRQTACISARR